ncbi:MAG TPA: hypothetical protein VGH89_03505, partial [Pseudonocardia sp.]
DRAIGPFGGEIIQRWIGPVETDPYREAVGEQTVGDDTAEGEPTIGNEGHPLLVLLTHQTPINRDRSAEDR